MVISKDETYKFQIRSEGILRTKLLPETIRSNVDKLISKNCSAFLGALKKHFVIEFALSIQNLAYCRRNYFLNDTNNKYPNTISRLKSHSV